MTFPHNLSTWTPAEGPVEIKDKVWRALAPYQRHKIQRLRKTRRPFEINLLRANHYEVKPL